MKPDPAQSCRGHLPSTMTHTSPESYLVWALVTSVLFTFLVYHMWSFDRFQCLRWNTGPTPGTFKRVMTYCYLLSVPLIMTYAIGFTVIKYRRGLMEFEGAIMPTPYIFWPENERRAIFPLMLTFAVAWSLEMITHLEELCFWLFLVNSCPQNWFQSRYFRAWIVGSCVAIIYMPMLTIWSRSDPLKCEAWTFLGGSLGSLTLTLSFSPVLWSFPTFLAGLKEEGVDIATIIRLTKFHELNTIRIVFRYVFVVPLVILGADGVRPHKHINESMLWTDFLTMIAAFGCCISSALTLVIFFPRSVETEIAAKEAARERRRSRSIASIAPDSARFSDYSNGKDMVPPSAKPYNFLASEDGHGVASPNPAHTGWTYDTSQELQMQQLPPLRPNRSVKPSTRRDLENENTYSSGVHPMVHNFTSPIQLYDGGKAPTMLEFTQH